jgi:hypothetical protein
VPLEKLLKRPGDVSLLSAGSVLCSENRLANQRPEIVKADQIRASATAEEEPLRDACARKIAARKQESRDPDAACNVKNLVRLPSFVQILFREEAVA